MTRKLQEVRCKGGPAVVVEPSEAVEERHTPSEVVEERHRHPLELVERRQVAVAQRKEPKRNGKNN